MATDIYSGLADFDQLWTASRDLSATIRGPVNRDTRALVYGGHTEVNEANGVITAEC